MEKLIIPKLKRRARVADMETTTLQIQKAFSEFTFTPGSDITLIMGNVNTVTAEFTDSIQRFKPESTLLEFDDVRSESIHTYGYIIKGYAYSLDAAIKAAGQTLLAVFDRFGSKLTNGSFGEKSTMTEAFIADMQTQEMLDALTVLPDGIAAFQAIVTAHNAFIEAQAHFRTELSSVDESQWASTLKLKVAGKINDELVNYLNSAISFAPDTYLAFAKAVKEIIDNTNMVIKMRFPQDEEPEENPQEIETAE